MKNIYIYIYIGEIHDIMNILLKTKFVNDLKAINNYQNKSDIRHSTAPYCNDVISQLVTSAHYQHQTAVL